MKKYVLLLIIMLFFITGCGGNSQRIVVYSSAEEERNDALKEQLKEKFPDLDVVVQYMPTGNNAAKIKSEGKNIEADIIIGLETAHMEGLKDNFADISYIDDSKYIEGINPKHNKYLIHEKSSVSIIIDKDYFIKNELEVPKTYEDLLKKEFKGLIAMPDPKTSNTGYAFYLNVYNEFGEKEALDYFDKLQGNIMQFTTSGSGPMSLLKQGEIAIAMGMTYQGATAITEGAKFEIVELETKTPYNTTASAIIDGKDKKENVKEVFEFIMNDFSKYDKEMFVPGKVFKEQDIKIKNYPTTLTDANMSGIEDVKLKEELLKKWKY